MSLELQFLKQKMQDQERRVHIFVSTVGNALERIEILIDEDEQDEAKQEITDLREMLGLVAEGG